MLFGRRNRIFCAGRHLGGGALLRNLSDNYAHSGLSNSTENLTPEEQAKAELNANILAGGGLGLDPENDPIVATTDWGLDIKFHAAGEYQGAGHLPGQKASNGNVSTAALKGYCYFTGGNYDGVTGLKWVIIGYSPTIITSTKAVLSTNLNIPDTTDAGNALKSASSKGLLMQPQRLILQKVCLLAHHTRLTQFTQMQCQMQKSPQVVCFA